MRKSQYLGNMVSSGNRRTFDRAIRTTKKLVEQFGEGAQPILLTHDCADPDGLCAQKFLHDYLAVRGLRPRIVTNLVTTTTIPLIERLGMTIADTDTTTGMYFVLDTYAKPLLNGVIENLEPERTTVIDHHIPDETSIRAGYTIINRIAISTCEMLASLVPRREITRENAFALAVGIVSDSERLRRAERKTIAIYERLLAIAKVKRVEIDELADPALSPEVKLAIGRDINFMVTGEQKSDKRNWVFAICQSTLETPFILANALRQMGMDISAAISEIESGAYKISFRIGFNDAFTTGVHANRIAKRTSQLCGMPQEMWGGGELDRAGAIVKGNVTDIIMAISRAIRETIDAA